MFVYKNYNCTDKHQIPSTMCKVWCTKCTLCALFSRFLTTMAFFTELVTMAHLCFLFSEYYDYNYLQLFEFENAIIIQVWFILYTIVLFVALIQVFLLKVNQI